MQIEVTVERILFAKPETKWYFFRATHDEATLICKGSMSWTPSEMETLSLVGDYVVYKGERQFQFRTAKLTLPLDAKSQLAYVCERAAGIGPHIRDEIWKLYGEKWRELKRGEIRKMTDSAYDRFIEQIEIFEKNKERAEVISWLENKGCTTGMANAAYDAWEKDAPGIVNADCYRLASLSGYSFKTVDENIRRNFDIADDDPRRIRAGITYAMEQGTESGSTVVNMWSHFNACQKLLPNIGDELIKDQVNAMFESGDLKPFFKYSTMALRSHYTSEEIIYQAILQNSQEESKIELDVAALASGEKFIPDESQIDAARFALTHKFAIINGGAGVGKTTIIKMIVAGIKQAYPALTVKLCAFAGKAAARLKEASGIEATTIHLLLGSRGENIFSAGSMESYAVIIDEASMVDSALLAEIIKRKPARLVLVGDQAQLAPVGHGQPFHDLIQIFPDSVRTLTKCYRNTEAVFQAATQIRNGNVPNRFAESANEKWIITPAPKPEQVQELICEWAQSNEIDFESDIVLCPKNGKRGDDESFEAATVNAMNQVLLRIDRDKRGRFDSEKFVPGDRVINTKNMAESQVWNGTTGTVHAVNSDNEIFVKLDVPVKDELTGEVKDTVLFDKEMSKNLRYAYALTVHKSQGSQYRKVFLVCICRDAYSLDRSLVYTAVTRTRKECVVVGDYNALIRSIQTIKQKETVMQMLCLENKQF